MEQRHSSSSRKAAAARINGRKGGTKNPEVSKWNSLGHALTAVKLGVLEGKHLPEYGDYVALRAELVRLLSPVSPLDLLAIEKFTIDAWRVRRAFRYELSATEQPDAGMSAPGMPTLLRYLQLANRQFDASYARILEMCERKKIPAAAQLAVMVACNLGDEQQAASHSAAADAFPQLAPVSVEPLTTPTTGQPEGAGKGEPPAESPLQAASSSAHPSDPGDGAPEERDDWAAAAEGGQPAPSAAVSSTPAREDEQSENHGTG